MRTISSASTAPQEMAGQSLVKDLGAALHRRCASFLTWRIERAAITQLSSMSDHQLGDIGISRSEIESAGRGEAERVGAFSRSS